MSEEYTCGCTGEGRTLFIEKTASAIILTLLLIGTLTLAFNIQAVKSSGTIYIRADGSVEGTDKIQRDGDVYTFTDNIYDEIVVERDNIVVDGTGYVVQGTSAPDSNGICLSGRKNVTIKNVEIRAFWTGICIAGSSNNDMVGNNLINNKNGIGLLFSSHNSIVENNITDNDYGISILDSSNHNSISGNNIANNGRGIWLAAEISGFGSSNNIISGNNITNNLGGIWLHTSSNNIISGNTITNNEGGINLIHESSNNKFYHNNFINNTQQVNIQTSGYTNSWDNGYPSGGNYWSNYTGMDVKSGPSQDLSESDGIGDKPYIIDENNRDRYPLMNPYGAPPPLTYALTITATVGGTTDPSPGTYSYTANSSVQVTAIPNADYTFDHWELDTVTISVYVGISYDLSYIGGLLVTSIVPGGPADKAGLKVGDVIKQVDSLQVNRAEDLIIYVERYKNPGDTVVLEIIRNNLIIQITLTLEHAPVGLPNPYAVLMDNNHTLKAVFTYSPPPPQLTASMSPLSASICVGQSVTFTSTVSGGYTPYSYQWYLNGAPVSGANQSSWTSTPATSGIYYVHLKVTDAKANTAQSETARITVATVPVGGYSIPIQVQTKTEPIIPYIALIATLIAILTKLRPKTKRKH